MPTQFLLFGCVLKQLYFIGYVINYKLHLPNLIIHDPAPPDVGHNLLKITRKIYDNHGSSHTILFYFTLEFCSVELFSSELNVNCNS